MTTPEVTLTDRLLSAWQAWDATPGHDTRARLFETVASEAAEVLGVSTSHLRDQLANGRRSGLSYEQAVRSAFQPGSD